MKKKYLLLCYLFFSGIISSVNLLQSQIHPNLVLCHRNDATNLFTDGSSFGNNGTNVGTPGVTLVNDRNGTANSAGYYDPNNYISIADNNSLDLSNCFTIMAWIRPNAGYGIAYNGHIDIVSKWGVGGPGNAAYMLALNTSGNILGWTHAGGVGGGFSQSTGTVTVNRWTHIAITFDGSNMRFYIDGVLNSTVANTIVPQNSTFPVKIGHEGENTAGNNGRGFDGDIDEVKIFNAALVPGAILALAGTTVNNCTTISDLSAFQPSFVNFPDNICEFIPLTVTLNDTDYLGNGIFDWGDGTTSSSNTKTYNVPGTYIVKFTTNGACPQTYTDTIVIDDCDPCDINDAKTEFTKSYTGPNGELIYESDIANIYQQREVNFSHVKKLANGEIVMAGSMIKDNIDNNSITNRQFEDPGFFLQRVPIIQKLDDKGKILISKRLDELTAAGSNISLIKSAELKRIAGMVTDASNNTYLLITRSRNSYTDTPPPNYFELIKLNSNLDPVTVTPGQHNYERVSFSGFDHIYPSDMIMASGLLRVLASAIDQSQIHHVVIATIPTTLKSAGTIRSATVNVWGNSYCTGKMTTGGGNIYFLFNHDQNVSTITNTEIYVGRYSIASNAFNLCRSFNSTVGHLYPEGIKYDPMTSNKILVYGSIYINNKHYPSLHILDNNLSLLSYNYYEYQPTTNANPADDVRKGTYGENAYADDVFFHNNSYIIHTTLRGEMDVPSYSQVPNLWNMVPGYFSVSKTANQYYAVDATFPSVFDPNIFKVNDRQKYFVHANNGILGEQLSGKFEEHFARFQILGGMLNTSDFVSNKIYNMDGMRTLSVLANTYNNAEVLTCFQEIEVDKVTFQAYPGYFNWQFTQYQPSSSYINPTLRATKLNISSSCCIPEYHRPCDDIGDIQVTFDFDCQTNKVSVSFSGTDVANIEMLQVYQVTPYDPTYNLGYFSDVLYNETGLTNVDITPTGGSLLDGDEYCIIIYAKNGCIKQFCTTIELPEVSTSKTTYDICGENNTVSYTPGCGSASTYTLKSNGGTPLPYTYPASSHNLGSGTHIFNSYNSHGCLKCSDTIIVNTTPADTVFHSDTLNVMCGTGIDLSGHEHCPLNGSPSSGLWEDPISGVSFSSMLIYMVNTSVKLKRVVQYTNCSLCIDEVVINVTQPGPENREFCIEENEFCRDFDINTLNPPMGCGPIMPGNQYKKVHPFGGTISYSSTGIFTFCRPFDYGVHQITYVNQFGCTCTLNLLVRQGPCPPAPIQFDKKDKLMDPVSTSNGKENSNVVRTQNGNYITVFPNPSSGIYNLVYTSPTTNQIVFNTEVYDISGKVVYHQSGLKSNQQEQLNLTELSPGIYTLKLILDNKTETIKLIKN